MSMDGDALIRARVAEHWQASERGDIVAEHGVCTTGAVLDYPQSGERFRGRARGRAGRA